MITFAVDDVTPAAQPLPTTPLRDEFPDALAIGGDPDLLVLPTNGVHPLLRAVGQAFADHRPLALSPDAVWLTITQGVAQHIRLHPDESRPMLINHSGRKRLRIEVDGPVPQDAEGWGEAVGRFQCRLAEQVKDADLFACDFSTSTDVDRIAAQVVLLDAYSPFFSYWMVAVCGIPSITLIGTAEDWSRIRVRVDELARFGLADWCRSLAAILDQFVRAAAGDVDLAFWQRIYNPVDAYGGKLITGWVARFYPYLSADGAQNLPNELLQLPIDEPRDLTADGRSYRGPGIRSSMVPAVLSRASIKINDRMSGDNRAVSLYGGVAAVTQDPDGALRPVAGWHVMPGRAEIGEVIDRIIAEHETTPPARSHPVLDQPAEMSAIYDRIGTASLFEGRWRIPQEPLPSVYRGGHLRSIRPAIELADGRTLCAVADHRSEDVHWVVCQVEQARPVNGRTLPLTASQLTIKESHLLDDPADIPVYGTSLALILDAALDNGGNIDDLVTGWLSDVDAADEHRGHRR
ncbi:DUF4419 domain-containing protein [Hamadaea sp. NPDC050747]|uniref:DUF4419 domain-containing protein n=1 Tax=Hamadaea sp. NPDC050747 TaxID=3155789 RepID=UPI0033CF417E